MRIGSWSIKTPLGAKSFLIFSYCFSNAYYTPSNDPLSSFLPSPSPLMISLIDLSKSSALTGLTNTLSAPLSRKCLMSEDSPEGMRTSRERNGEERRGKVRKEEVMCEWGKEFERSRVRLKELKTNKQRGRVENKREKEIKRKGRWVRNGVGRGNQFATANISIFDMMVHDIMHYSVQWTVLS